MATHTIEILDTCQRRILVTISKEEVQSVKNEEAERISRSKNSIPPGFRPNHKETKRYIEKNLGSFPNALKKVHQKLFDDSLKHALTQEKLKPVWPVELLEENQTFHRDGSLSYIGEFEIYPPISHVNWENITLEKLEAQITESDIENTITQLDMRNTDTKLQEETDEIKNKAQQWAESMLTQAKWQHLKSQVMTTLVKQNPITALPAKLMKHHYELFKKSYPTESEEILHQKSQTALIQDILIDAYIREHRIQLDAHRFETKIQEIKSAFKNQEKAFNLFIQNKDMYYQLSMHTLTDQVIDHLLEKVHYISKASTYQEIINFKKSSSINEKKRI